MKTFYHWTFRHCLGSILDQGLKRDKATGKLPAVWVCDSTRYAEAQFHIAERHDMPLETMVLLRVLVDFCELTQTKWDGVYYLLRDVEPRDITVVLYESPALLRMYLRDAPHPEVLTMKPIDPKTCQGSSQRNPRKPSKKRR